MVVHGRPKTHKNTSFGVIQPQGSHSPYILGDTTRPGHVTCVLVWPKSDRRRLRKTLHKQTDKQTDTTKIMVTWPWTKKWCGLWTVDVSNPVPPWQRPWLYTGITRRWLCNNGQRTVNTQNRLTFEHCPSWWCCPVFGFVNRLVRFW